ncbi:hypothetical protein ACVTP5_001779 [Vibrio parahaemolyticus]|uniref:hypothetical protein n=2 Tax=Vibrio parahaemolyticus TaxID=670 RepID=UPI002119B71D|nr:hypothetical protein [Vibrio parahaemolyticus]MCR9716236.1 hypothetical protein [Vibrio parahaemolyticus]
MDINISEGLIMKNYNVKIKDETMGRFYARQLSKYNFPVQWETSINFDDNIELINIAVNIHKYEYCEKVINKIENKYKSILFIKGNLRKNERFCNFTWYYIQKKFSEKIKLKSDGRSHKEREREVKINIGKLNRSRYYYGELERVILDKWCSSSKNNDIVSWLKEEEQIKWAWSYIIKQEPLVIKYIWNNKKSTQDLKDFIIAFFDIIEDNKRDITIKRIKKAWDQKKFRDKVQSKNQYCINLSEGSNEKLKAISTSKNMKRNKVIELLINNEFLRL